ncbi:hypothetical protein CSB20_05320, partial [bacterium DOLZORAL124_64_63]
MDNVLLALFVFVLYIEFITPPAHLCQRLPRPAMSIIAVDSFVPDQSAAEVSACLKRAVRAMDQARHCAVLWFKEIVERELYKELGYGSVYQYAAVE